MLKIDSWKPMLPTATRVATRPARYVPHAGQSTGSLARLLRDHCVDHRCVDRLTAWANQARGRGLEPDTEDAYAVLGWTSAAILRSTLSRRLDSLNPVAAYRLLEQPEISRLELGLMDYVVLRSRYGFGNEWGVELGGAISALDIDLWMVPGPTELDGAVALDLDSYLRHFAGTEIDD